MTSVPIWLAVVVPILAAATAGGLALLGVIVKSRSDARAAARAAQQARAETGAQWVRERRERVYAEFLQATTRYVATLPDGQPFDVVRYPIVQGYGGDPEVDLGTDDFNARRLLSPTANPRRS